ncbi:MAG: D-aminoacylase [Candidatus Aminicenantes bacterium]|nr:D-aminoacylase [Candidatus Aminicenantes bacterium]
MRKNKRKKISRRQFLRQAGQVVLSGGLLTIMPGCRSYSRSYDLIIKDALVVDGSGRPPFSADLGIKGNHITTIGKIGNNQARRIIKANGLSLAPGFIDAHNHTDVQLLVCPTADSLLHQGVTTIVAGNCGSSPFPLTEEMLAEEQKYLREEYGLEVDWQDLAGFFRRLEASRPAINYATLVGQGTIRAAVVGYANRAASAGELQRMKQLLEEALKQGAMGLSTGLEYSPGSFASTEELIELSRVLRDYAGIYATHMRDEEDQVLEALDEAIAIAKKAGVKLEVSHLKIGYPRNWSKIDALLDKIDEAAHRGLKISADVYPYTAFSTGLSIFFPLWVREGKKEDFLSRLKDPKLEPRLRQAFSEAEANVGSWEKVLISSVRTEKNRWLEGLNLQEASTRRGVEVFTLVRDLLLEEEGQVSMVCFAMSEENLKIILKHPLTCIGSDGELAATSGPLYRGKPHPRYYGTFPRVLVKYVREEPLLKLEEMIRKMTSWPARIFGFSRRGLIKEGYLADLVLFDLKKLDDKATWANPHQYPEGIFYVLVNGQVVLENGQITGCRPGQVLRNRGNGQVC